MEKQNLEQIKVEISETIKKLASFMNLECQVELKEPVLGSLVAAIYTLDNARFLIGKNGQNLQALEHILKAIFLKKWKEAGLISLDVNDYRKSRSSYLLEIAKTAVMRVRNTQKAEALTPMPPHERRIVHMELASYPDIATESIGQEPQRRVIIKPL